jgi:transcriptional regulator with XRE-family HTH domain
MDIKVNRIRQIRRKQGITQEELGKITEIDQSDISKIETGKIMGLTLINAAKIAKALGYSIEYIWPHLLD